MKVRRPCRGFDGPCTRGTTSFGGRCALCHRRWLRARAVALMRELAGLAVADVDCQPAGEQQQSRRPQRDEEADGTVWTWDDGDAAAQ